MFVVLGVIFTIFGVLYLSFRFGLIPWKAERTSSEVARYIQDFIDQAGGDWDWDDFTSIAISDPRLDEIRLRCSATHDEFASSQDGEWCTPEGIDLLRAIISELNADVKHQD